MQVTVELFGIPRLRAGVAKTTAQGTVLGDILFDLANRFPGLAKDCIDGKQLRAGYTVNLGGNRFVSSPETALGPDDTVMLLSLDAGG